MRRGRGFANTGRPKQSATQVKDQSKLSFPGPPLNATFVSAVPLLPRVLSLPTFFTSRHCDALQPSRALSPTAHGARRIAIPRLDCHIVRHLLACGAILRRVKRLISFFFFILLARLSEVICLRTRNDPAVGRSGSGNGGVISDCLCQRRGPAPRLQQIIGQADTCAPWQS